MRRSLYCYSQQIIFAVANAFLISYNFTKRAPEKQNFQYCNTECHPKPNQKNVKYNSVLRTKDFVPQNINNKNMCKIVCKMLCLKNGL